MNNHFGYSYFLFLFYFFQKIIFKILQIFPFSYRSFLTIFLIKLIKYFKFLNGFYRICEVDYERIKFKKRARQCKGAS